MKYLLSIVLILVVLSGCNDGSNSNEDVSSVKNVPQPSVKNSELQPPKPPSL